MRNVPARVARLASLSLVVVLFVALLGPGVAGAQQLVVAGAPPIHEVTMPHLGAQSSKLL